MFWDKGRKHLARRWAAENIHGIDLFGKETEAACGDERCVQHVKAETPVYPNRQFQVLADLGYCGYTDRPKPDHDGPPFYESPEWLEKVTG